MELTDEKGNPINSSQEIETSKGLLDLAETDGVKSTFSTEDTIKAIKASDRTRSKNLTAHHRDYSNISKTDMEKQGEKLYAGHFNKVKQEQEKDKSNGFDVTDPENIKHFRINYTPLGNTVLVKRIHEEEETDKDKTENKIILPAGLDQSDRKYIVMVPGILVSILQRGDIVTLKGSHDGKISSVERKFNNVKFDEIDYYAIAGVFKSQDEIKTRIDSLTEEYKKANA